MNLFAVLLAVAACRAGPAANQREVRTRVADPDPVFKVWSDPDSGWIYIFGIPLKSKFSVYRY